MRKDTKPTPEKYCQYCGKKLERKRYSNSVEDLTRFSKRKYCGIECLRRAYIGNGKKEKTWGPAHKTARGIVYLIEDREKVCSRCGSTTNVDMHHKDHNHSNNASENLVLLCRSCHMKEHHSQIHHCSICGKEIKHPQRGMCDKHYIRWRKYGDPNHKPWSQYKEKESKGPVMQFTMDGVLVAQYKDARTAAKETPYARPSISSVCNGNRKSLGGYLWRYGKNERQQPNQPSLFDL